MGENNLKGKIMAKSRAQIAQEQAEAKIQHGKVAELTKKIKKEYPNLVFVVVGITVKQQFKFIKYLDYSVKLGKNMIKEDYGEMQYIQTEIDKKPVFFAIAPAYEKYVNMYLNAPNRFETYRNESNFCYNSLKEAYCVNFDGELIEPGRYALIEVNDVSKKTAENIEFLRKDIPEKLSVVAKFIEEEDRIVYYAVSSISGARNSTINRKATIDFCNDKLKRLALALNNCKTANVLDITGKVKRPVTCHEGYRRRSNEEMLKLAQSASKVRENSRNIVIATI